MPTGIPFPIQIKNVLLYKILRPKKIDFIIASEVGGRKGRKSKIILDP